MEKDILLKLQFGIHFTSPFRFLERFLQLKNTRETEKNFSLFLLEGCLVQYKMLKYKPSVLAASSLYLANKLCFNKEPWSHKMTQLTHLEESTLRVCARDIHQQVLLTNIDEKSRLKSVFDKFASSKYGQVSYKIQMRAYKRSCSQKQKPLLFEGEQSTARGTPSGKKKPVADNTQKKSIGPINTTMRTNSMTNPASANSQKQKYLQ